MKMKRQFCQAYRFPEGVKLDLVCNVNGGEHYGVIAVEVISFN